MSEPVVLIPGLMCDARVFTHQINALSGSGSVMVAAPVSGERMEEMGSVLLDTLPARFALAGAGLGASVAIEILRRAPERVNRLCLISGDAQSDSPATAGDREVQLARARAGRLDDVIAEVYPPDHLAPGPARVEILATCREMSRALGADVFVRQTRALQRRRDYLAVLRRVKVPCMVIGGALDPVLPPKRQQFLADLIPNARWRAIEDAGHLPMLEQPGETTAALCDWLAQPLVLG